MIAWLFLLQIYVIADGAQGACPVDRMILNATAVNILVSRLQSSRTRLTGESVHLDGLRPVTSIQFSRASEPNLISRDSRMIFLPANIPFDREIEKYLTALHLPFAPPIFLSRAHERLLGATFRGIWPSAPHQDQLFFLGQATVLHTYLIEQFPELGALALLARNPSEIDAAKALLSRYIEPTQFSLLAAAQEWVSAAASSRQQINFGAFLVRFSPDSPTLQRLVESAAAGFAAGGDHLSIPFIDTVRRQMPAPIISTATPPQSPFELQVPAPIGSMVPTLRFGPELFTRNQNRNLLPALRRAQRSSDDANRMDVLQSHLQRGTEAAIPLSITDLRTSMDRLGRNPPVSREHIAGVASPLLVSQHSIVTRSPRLLVARQEIHDIDRFNRLATVVNIGQLSAHPVSSISIADMHDRFSESWPFATPERDIFETYLPESAPFYGLMLERFPEIAALQHLARVGSSHHGAAQILREAGVLAAESHANSIEAWLTARRQGQRPIKLDLFLSQEGINQELAQKFGVLATISYLATGKNVVLPYGNIPSQNRIDPYLLFTEHTHLTNFAISIPSLRNSAEATIQIGRPLIRMALRVPRVRALLNSDHSVYEEMVLIDAERDALRARIAEIRNLQRAR